MSDILSAICPLRVQKLSQKQRKRIFVYCSKMPYFGAFLHISTSREKCAKIFNSRTGHQLCISQMPILRRLRVLFLLGFCTCHLHCHLRFCKRLFFISKRKCISNRFTVSRLRFLKHMTIDITRCSYAGMSHITEQQKCQYLF